MLTWTDPWSLSLTLGIRLSQDHIVDLHATSEFVRECYKHYQKLHSNRYFSRFDKGLVQDLDLNWVHYFLFVLGTILNGKRNLLHHHICTSNKSPTLLACSWCIISLLTCLYINAYIHQHFKKDYYLGVQQILYLDAVW